MPGARETSAKRTAVKRSRALKGTVASMPTLVRTPPSETRTYSCPRIPGMNTMSLDASTRVATAYSTWSVSVMSMSSSTTITWSRSLRAAKAASMALRCIPSSRAERLATWITKWNRYSPPAVSSASDTMGLAWRRARRALASSTCLRSITVSRPAPLMAW